MAYQNEVAAGFARPAAVATNGDMLPSRSRNLKHKVVLESVTQEKKKLRTVVSSFIVQLQHLN